MAAADLAAARALACISVLAALAAAQTLLSGSASSSVAQGETHYYYVIANCGFSLTVNLQPSSGDADLIVRVPATGQAWSSAAGGTSLDSVSINIDSGHYIAIDVYGFTAASYTVSRTLSVTGSSALSTAVSNGDVTSITWTFTQGFYSTTLNSDFACTSHVDSRFGTATCRYTSSSTLVMTLSAARTLVIGDSVTFSSAMVPSCVSVSTVTLTSTCTSPTISLAHLLNDGRGVDVTFSGALLSSAGAALPTAASPTSQCSTSHISSVGSLAPVQSGLLCDFSSSTQLRIATPSVLAVGAQVNVASGVYLAQTCRRLITFAAATASAPTCSGPAPSSARHRGRGPFIVDVYFTVGVNVTGIAAPPSSTFESCSSIFSTSAQVGVGVTCAHRNSTHIEVRNISGTLNGVTGTTLSIASGVLRLSDGSCINAAGAQSVTVTLCSLSLTVQSLTSAADGSSLTVLFAGSTDMGGGSALPSGYANCSSYFSALGDTQCAWRNTSALEVLMPSGRFLAPLASTAFALPTIVLEATSECRITTNSTLTLSAPACSAPGASVAWVASTGLHVALSFDAAPRLGNGTLIISLTSSHAAFSCAVLTQGGAQTCQWLNSTWLLVALTNAVSFTTVDLVANSLRGASCINSLSVTSYAPSPCTFFPTRAVIASSSGQVIEVSFSELGFWSANDTLNCSLLFGSASASALRASQATCTAVNTTAVRIALPSIDGILPGASLNFSSSAPLRSHLCRSALTGFNFTLEPPACTPPAAARAELLDDSRLRLVFDAQTNLARQTQMASFGCASALSAPEVNASTCAWWSPRVVDVLSGGFGLSSVVPTLGPVAGVSCFAFATLAVANVSGCRAAEPLSVYAFSSNASAVIEFSAPTVEPVAVGSSQTPQTLQVCPQGLLVGLPSSAECAWLLPTHLLVHGLDFATLSQITVNTSLSGAARCASPVAAGDANASVAQQRLVSGPRVELSEVRSNGSSSPAVLTVSFSADTNRGGLPVNTLLNASACASVFSNSAALGSNFSCEWQSSRSLLVRLVERPSTASEGGFLVLNEALTGTSSEPIYPPFLAVRCPLPIASTAQFGAPALGLTLTFTEDMDFASTGGAGTAFDCGLVFYNASVLFGSGRACSWLSAREMQVNISRDAAIRPNTTIRTRERSLRTANCTRPNVEQGIVVSAPSSPAEPNVSLSLVHLFTGSCIEVTVAATFHENVLGEVNYTWTLANLTGAGNASAITSLLATQTTASVALPSSLLEPAAALSLRVTATSQVLLSNASTQLEISLPAFSFLASGAQFGSDGLDLVVSFAENVSEAGSGGVSANCSALFENASVVLGSNHSCTWSGGRSLYVTLSRDAVLRPNASLHIRAGSFHTLNCSRPVLAHSIAVAPPSRPNSPNLTLNVTHSFWASCNEAVVLATYGANLLGEVNMSWALLALNGSGNASAIGELLAAQTGPSVFLPAALLEPGATLTLRATAVSQVLFSNRSADLDLAVPSFSLTATGSIFGSTGYEVTVGFAEAIDVARSGGVNFSCANVFENATLLLGANCTCEWASNSTIRVALSPDAALRPNRTLVLRASSVHSLNCSRPVIAHEIAVAPPTNPASPVFSLSAARIAFGPCHDGVLNATFTRNVLGNVSYTWSLVNSSGALNASQVAAAAAAQNSRIALIPAALWEPGATYRFRVVLFSEALLTNSSAEIVLTLQHFNLSAVTAAFSANVSFLHVNFTEPTNRAGISNSTNIVPCASVFTQPSLFGANASCSWASSRELVVSLQGEFLLRIGHVLTLVNLQRASVDCSIAPTPTAVLAPATRAVPAASAVASHREVSSCVTFNLSGSSAGVAGALLHSWSLVDNVDPGYTGLELSPLLIFLRNASSSGFRVAPELTVPNTNYTFLYRATSVVLNTTSPPAAVHLTVLSFSVPNVTILGAPLLLTRRNRVTMLVASAAYENCPGQAAATLTFNWVQLRGAALPAASCSSHIAPSAGTLIGCGATLRIQQDVLQPEVDYEFAAYAAVADSLDIKSASTIVVRAQRGPLEALIRGGPERKVRFRTPTVFDGSISIDRDLPAGVRLSAENYTFKWTCWSVTLGQSCTGLLIDADKAVARIDELVLTIGHSYLVRFEVADNTPGVSQRVAVATQNITCMDSPIASPIIRTELLPEQINQDDRLVIESETPDIGVTLVWESVAERVNLSDPRFVASSKSVNGRTTHSLVIRPGVLQAGTNYQFRLVATNGQWAAASVVDLRVNSPPSGGNCSISPLVGNALQTLFVLECVGFADPEGHAPVLYTIGYSLFPRGVPQPNDDATESEENEPRLILTGSTSGTAAVYLPQGRGDGDLLTVIFFVVDAFGATARFAQNVTVHPPNVPAGEELNFIATQGVQLVQSALNRNNPAEARLVLSVAGEVVNSLSSSLDVGPCAGNCSGNGVCNASRCVCFEGWAGERCDVSDASLGERRVVRGTLMTLLANAEGQARVLGSRSQNEIRQVGQVLGTLLDRPGEVSTASEDRGFEVVDGLLSTGNTVTSLDFKASRTLLKVASDIDESSNDRFANGGESARKEAASERLLSMVDRLSLGVLQTAAIGEAPVSIATDTILLSARKDAPSALEGSPLSLGVVDSNVSVGAAFPRGSISSDGAAVELHMVAWKNNPFAFDNSSSLSSPGVFSFKFASAQSDAELPVRGLEEPIVFSFPLNLSPQQAEAARARRVAFEVGVRDGVQNTTARLVSALSQLFVNETERISVIGNHSNVAAADAAVVEVVLEFIDRDPPSVDERFEALLLTNKSVFVEMGVLRAQPVQGFSVTLPRCEFWDKTARRWSTEGCTSRVNYTALVLQCRCTHLTDFSTVLRQQLVGANWSIVTASPDWSNPVAFIFVCSLLAIFSALGFKLLREDRASMRAVERLIDDRVALRAEAARLYDSRRPGKVLPKQGSENDVVTARLFPPQEKPSSKKEAAWVSLSKQHRLLAPFFGDTTQTYSKFARILVLLAGIMLELFVSALWYSTDGSQPKPLSLQERIARGILAALFATPLMVAVAVVFSRADGLKRREIFLATLLRRQVAAVLVQRALQRKVISARLKLWFSTQPRSRRLREELAQALNELHARVEIAKHQTGETLMGEVDVPRLMVEIERGVPASKRRSSIIVRDTSSGSLAGKEEASPRAEGGESGESKEAEAATDGGGGGVAAEGQASSREGGASPRSPITPQSSASPRPPRRTRNESLTIDMASVRRGSALVPQGALSSSRTPSPSASPRKLSAVSPPAADDGALAEAPPSPRLEGVILNEAQVGRAHARRTSALELMPNSGGAAHHRRSSTVGVASAGVRMTKAPIVTGKRAPLLKVLPAFDRDQFLPRWAEAVAYFYLFGSIGFCSYFVSNAGFVMGNSRTLEWITTVLTSFASANIVFDPLKIVFLALAAPMLQASLARRARRKRREAEREAKRRAAREAAAAAAAAAASSASERGATSSQKADVPKPALKIQVPPSSVRAEGTAAKLMAGEAAGSSSRPTTPRGEAGSARIDPAEIRIRVEALARKEQTASSGSLATRDKVRLVVIPLAYSAFAFAELAVALLYMRGWVQIWSLAVYLLPGTSLVVAQALAGPELRVNARSKKSVPSDAPASVRVLLQLANFLQVRPILESYRCFLSNQRSSSALRAARIAHCLLGSLTQALFQGALLGFYRLGLVGLHSWQGSVGLCIGAAIASLVLWPHGRRKRATSARSNRNEEEGDGAQASPSPSPKPSPRLAPKPAAAVSQTSPKPATAPRLSPKPVAAAKQPPKPLLAPGKAPTPASKAAPPSAIKAAAPLKPSPKPSPRAAKK